MPSVVPRYAVVAVGATRLYPNDPPPGNGEVQVSPPSVLFRTPALPPAYSVKGCDGLTANANRLLIGTVRGVQEPPPLVLTYSVDEGKSPFQAYITSGFDRAIAMPSTDGTVIPVLLVNHEAPPSTLFMIAAIGSAAPAAANTTFDAPGRTTGMLPFSGNAIHVAPPSMLLWLLV